MPTIRVDGKVHNHRVVSEPQWLVARKTLLAKEKRYTRLGDRLNQERRRLPWVKVDKYYVFDGPNGKETLSALFGKRSQLIVYHFMFPREWSAGCPHCSFWADHYDGTQVHLNHRDTTLVAISRAPFTKIKKFQARMGWKFKWLSSGGSEFNYDFHASFTPEENRKGAALFNYEKTSAGFTDREGASVFYKDRRGDIYHTYSTYARGIDILNGTYHFLDLVPKGRDEGNRGQYWVRHHDKYKFLCVGSGARLALRRHPVASRRELRAQDELALETARLEAAVRLGDLLEGDPLGDARLDGASCQQAEEPLEVLPEPGGMSRPHHVDRVDAGALAASQPLR